MISYRESAELAKRPIEHTCRKENIGPGQAPHILAHRQLVPDAACVAHLGRFVHKPHKPPELPTQVRINKPSSEETTP
jgi:hypothetical protein